MTKVFCRNIEFKDCLQKRLYIFVSERNITFKYVPDLKCLTVRRLAEGATQTFRYKRHYHNKHEETDQDGGNNQQERILHRPAMKQMWR